MKERRITSLKEFYPFYLTEHTHSISRILHFTGTALVLIMLIAGFALNWRFFIAIPFVGYGFAWIGHFFFEKNKPATFNYPLYSLASDFILFYDLLTGKQSFNVKR
jgi:hypothetical protein